MMEASKRSSEQPAPARASSLRHATRATICGTIQLGAAVAVQAQTPAPLETNQFPAVEITGYYNSAVGTSDAASRGMITSRLLQSRPVMRPAEVLESVPGLIVTQHSGDGKANQYFLRGFNLDHGTDFATFVNGIPVNMPTHGHGQGYTDLNFLIPELVRRIDYRKGPYFADSGDFASAGSADISYKTRLDAPFGQVSLGKNGYKRLVAAGSGTVGGDGGLTLLGAVEMLRNDGPWATPENLRRSNGVVTVSSGTTTQGWSASMMTYEARWNATNQVPQRLIDAGSYQGRPFDRFDNIDASDGATTRRNSVSGEWHRRGPSGTTRVSAYAMDYRLDLYSNHTYFLERPDNGDQARQHDDRSVWGLRATQAFDHTLGSLPAMSEFGLQMRRDRIRVGLDETVARRVTATIREDRVRETLAGAWGQSTVTLTPTLRAVGGLRVDHLRTEVEALTLDANSGAARGTQFSPKLTLIAGPFAKTEFFFNAGRGFHSNDARGTTAAVNPKSGEAVARVPPLVASTGYELGLRTEALPDLQTSIAVWKLDFDSELKYIGDAGTTEPSEASRRWGVEWSSRWTPEPWFLLDADLAWSHARFANGDRIPNAVDKVASLGATVRDYGPFSASLRWRYLGSGALIEDNSVRSKSSLTTNLRLGWRFSPKADLALDVFNLLDRRVNDIQYWYASQLPGEPGPVADFHVHPAEPRSARLTLRIEL